MAEYSVPICGDNRMCFGRNGHICNLCWVRLERTGQDHKRRSGKVIACVASVSVGFQSKKGPKNGISKFWPREKWRLKLRKSRSSDIFCSENPRKRLLSSPHFSRARSPSWAPGATKTSKIPFLGLFLL